MRGAVHVFRCCVFASTVLALGCSGPIVVPSGSSSSSGDAEPLGTTTTTSTSTTGPAQTVTTVGTASTMGASTEETGDSTGLSGFILVPDWGGDCGDGFCPGAEGVSASCIACSYFDQDCGRGEVCRPQDSCDGGTWTRSACVPAAPGANGEPGAPCTMEEGPYSGLDDCGPQAMCFDVDPVTLEGTCTAFCEADSRTLDCEDPSQTCFRGNEGWAPLCLLRCSPLLGDCPAGQGCYPGTQDDFVCITEGLPLYNDLETLHPACPPGSFMTSAAGACPDQTPCCVEYCDLAAPACDLGSHCVAFFDDLEGVDRADHDVGFCSPDLG